MPAEHLPLQAHCTDNVRTLAGTPPVPRLARTVTEPQELEQQRPLAQHLAQRLRELRARHGLTQDRVAKELGVHESAVSRWEGGTRFPTGEDLVMLSDLFRVSIDYLLGKERQYAAPGNALVDQVLLDRLEAAATTEEFDRLIAAHEEQAIWLPVPEGSVLVPVGEAMRRARRVADKHRQSRYVDRLFRPRL
jgi:transcriptional regulator with XRE-family HTH domain